MARPAHTLRDAAVQQLIALPAAASTNVTSQPIDTQNGPNGHFLAPCELVIEAPALSTTILPNAAVATYKVVHGDAVDANGNIVSPVDLIASAHVQTGAGGAGAAAAEKRYRLPVNVKRFVALNVAFGANATTGAALKAGIDFAF